MIFCGCPVPADEEEKNRMSEFARETRMKGIIAPEERTETIAEYKKVCGDKMSLFSLREGCFEDAIGWGADAVISYLSTLIPETCVRRESDIRYHSHRRPAEEKGVLARLDSLMLAASSRPAVAREVLRNAWGVDCGSVRPPWTEMTEEDRKIAAECVGVIRGM